MSPDLWQTHPWLALASLAPVPLGAVWMACARAVPGLKGRPALTGWLTWLLTRAAFGGLLWGVLGHAGIDQLTFFLPQARAAIAGGVPYRDFASAYGPLFAPLLGVCVVLLGNVGPFLLFLVADLGAWRALAAAEGEESEAAWAYVAMPLVWYLTVRYAQDEALGALFVALAWWAVRRDRLALAGLTLGTGLIVTKPLFALLVLPFALALGRRSLTVISTATAPVVVAYGTLLALGAPIAQPFALEGGSFGVGPTLWRVPAVLARLDLGPSGWLPLAAVVAWGAWRLTRRGEDAATHAASGFGAFAALSPKFMPMYAVMWAPLLSVWAGRAPDRRRWLVAYGTLLPVAWYLDSGPLQGLFGTPWQVVAATALVGVATLGLWPLWQTTRNGRLHARLKRAQLGADDRV